MTDARPRSEAVESAVAAAFSQPPGDARRTVAGACVAEDHEFVAAVLDRATANVRKDPRLAFWTAHAAARRARSAGAPRLAARAHRVAGGALAALGRPRLALAAYDRALRDTDPAADPADFAAAEVKRIHPLALLGRHEEAVRAAAAARRVRETLGDPVGLAEVDVALGDHAFRRDLYRDALRHYTRARGNLAPEKYRRLRAILDCNSANCLEALNRWGAAQRLFDRARAAFDADGLAATVAQVDHNRAYFAFLRGRYDEALRLYAAAEASFTALDDPRQLGQVALESAEVLLQMGVAGDARARAAAAAAAFGKVGLAKERAQALVLGAVAGAVEGRSGGTAAIDEARNAFAAEGSERWVAECDLVAASFAESRGDLAAARRLAESAQAVLLRGSGALRAGSADLLLARLDVAEGRSADALARIARAEERLGGIAAPWLDVELKRVRGLAHLGAGEDARAAAVLLGAVASLEAHRGAVPADEFMVAFLASRASLFEETIEALLRTGRAAAAFECSEKARARALADLLADRRAPRSAEDRRDRPSVRVLADRRVDRLREELNALRTRMHRGAAAGADAGAAAGVRADVARREAELAEALRRRGSESGETVAPGVAPTAGQVRRSLGADTTLVAYARSRGGLHAFVVTEGGVEHRPIAAGEAHVASLVQRFRFHLAKFDVSAELGGSDLSLRATRANLEDLSAAVLGPVRDLVRTPRLVVVPHGAMHLVPFHALPDGDGWLADRVDVVHAPSAAVYAACGARRPAATGAPTVLALPDEAAPLIDREAAAVSAALGPGTRVLRGPAATAAALRDAARTSRVLHVATHGMFRSGEPTMSCLRLADAWLSLHDVYGLDIRGDLVVLSACESGLASVATSGDPLGLLRGFLVAGAPRLLASLWRVGDGSTAAFMESFHAEFAATGDVGASLRRARADVRRSHPHPFHWAAFTLFGHPGAPRREACAAESVHGRRGRAGASRRVSCGSQL